jgi:hypothetical protein
VPKYVFTHNIGINSPFLHAINLFSYYSPQDGTYCRNFVLSPPDADYANADADADAAYYGNKMASHPINQSIHPSIPMSQSRFLHEEYSKKIRKVAVKAAIDSNGGKRLTIDKGQRATNCTSIR